MHPLEKATLAVLRRDKLAGPGDIVLIAVSGGPDSMALLHVLAGLAPAGDFTLHAAYIDHGLRPAEARREKELVRERAGRLGVAFHAAAVDVGSLAKARKQSLEETARQERYRLLEEISGRVGATRIALAHTADDQAEELLLRLLRGTGRMGLSGMRTMRAGRFIRPFLGMEKERLLAYLADRDIPSLLDSSNRQRTFLRNRVRLDLLPYLAAHFNANIRRTLRQTADILAAEEVVLEGLANEAWAGVAVETVPGAAAGAGSGRPLVLELERFRELNRAIQRRLVEKGCWHMGSTPAFRQVEQILRLAVGPAPGILHLSGGLRVERAAGKLIFACPRGRGPRRGDPDEAEKYFELRIEGPGRYRVEPQGRTITLELPDRLPGEVAGDGGVEYLDRRLIAFPLLLRSPRPGDRFHPLGAPGRRKVGDFLTDRKVPVEKRWQVPVLVSGKEIVALVGLRIDHRFRVTSGTREVLRLGWEEEDWNPVA